MSDLKFLLRLSCWALVIATGLSLISSAQAQTTAAPDAWALLKTPGHIALLRHANAPGRLFESNDMDFSDCSIQRNLDDTGRAQAARIGDEFRKHGMSQVQLFSSQYCRARETARLLKLGPVTVSAGLNQLLDKSKVTQAVDDAHRLMKTIPANRVAMLVTHVSNIQMLTGEGLRSGEFVVVHFDESGKIVVDASVMVP